MTARKLNPKRRPRDASLDDYLYYLAMLANRLKEDGYTARDYNAMKTVMSVIDEKLKKETH